MPTILSVHHLPSTPVKATLGVYHLPKSRITRQEFECAAWYRDILVPAGNYPITAILDNNKVRDHTLRVSFKGVITASNLSGYYCGVLIKSKINEDVGQK